MPVTRNVPAVGSVTVIGQGPFVRKQTGGANGAFGIYNVNGVECEVNLGSETGSKVFAETDASLATLDAIIETFNEPYPTNTVPPAITGDAVEGGTLTASTGTWTGDPTITYEYQWLLDGAPIAGADSNSYEVQAGDVGGNISVQVTATNDLGSVSVVSTETETVAAAE